MRSDTAAGLVGAAILSTLIYPLIGLRLRRGGDPETAGRPAGVRLVLSQPERVVPQLVEAGACRRPSAEGAVGRLKL